MTEFFHFKDAIRRTLYFYNSFVQGYNAPHLFDLNLGLGVAAGVTLHILLDEALQELGQLRGDEQSMSTVS